MLSFLHSLPSPSLQRIKIVKMRREGQRKRGKSDRGKDKGDWERGGEIHIVIHHSSPIHSFHHSRVLPLPDEEDGDDDDEEEDG